jgi:hypothetical protein
MMHGSQLTFCCVSRSDGRAQLIISWHDRRKINGNKSKQILNLKSEFYCFLASNQIAQFFRQTVVQILGLESPKVFWKSRNTFTLFESQYVTVWQGLKKKLRHVLSFSSRNTFTLFESQYVTVWQGLRKITFLLWLFNNDCCCFCTVLIHFPDIY